MIPHSRLAVFNRSFIISISTSITKRVTSFPLVISSFYNRVSLFPPLGRVRVGYKGQGGYHFITSVIPGLSPSNFVTGRAFTSKVFRSY